MAAADAGGGFDCIVIGGGHNGLVCATLLARGGRSVALFEANDLLGGAAATREFAAGFRVSACAHLLHSMPAALQRELRLQSYGFATAATGMASTALVADGAALAIGAADLAAADAAAYARYDARMRRLAAALAPMLSRAPPRLGTRRWSELAPLLELGWRVRRLGARDMRELLRIAGMNVYDLLEENFESAALKGALALDAVLGANLGPRSPGSVLTLLHRLAGECAAGAAGLTQPLGGMGGLCDALARAARAAGVTIRTSSPVARIEVEADRASGVVLEGGERIAAGAVISSADPKTTFLHLLGARHLDAGFVRRVTHFRSRGLAAKLHLALDRAPQFTGLIPGREAGRLLIAPSLQYIERAYNHAKYGEYSQAPVMEITVPTINDPGLAPAGGHVLSAIVQYAPYSLKGGWELQRGGFADLAIDTIARYAPGLRRSIVASELLSPPDLEREFRISGGHWHHGDMALDQFWMVRPVPGAAQYRTPLDGLFLCGAGCHPGGGVVGAAGRNAARQVLQQAA
ncbi:MAG TPA: NAD(P)/FAD-dependent oxidoreductase [Steroidobacteraceae bacterium]|nr:NAD(P)/FAD-dependent oxidoreductase [Steroidobacteraceae bacterium]